jgi:hypothetical protein
MASGLEPAHLPDVESGPYAMANDNGEVSATRSRRGARFMLLAAAALGSMGVAAVYQASPPMASVSSLSAARRQLSAHWNKEYSREVRSAFLRRIIAMQVEGLLERGL